MIDPYIQAFITALLLMLFAGTAWHKVTGFRDFQSVVTAYAIAPLAYVKPVAFLVIGFELAVIGTLLWVPEIGIITGCMLLLFYGVLIAFNIVRGNRYIDCGCTWGRSNESASDRLEWRHVYRNIGLVIFAATGLLPATDRLLSWIDYINLGFSLAAVLTVYLTISTLIRNWLRMKEHAHV